ncbi:cyclin-dependent kinase 3 [Histomonas meleagridis]|uniref:cyclin-dependent kinase 3 n=1 Tax=Histomonas meleagridis TaxID=135588 RepID=UPI0035599A1D|nr:cyclin-dependent kinase 3 [Histomonas meleagridis]KAH0799033.1 cyclin-dependent kinase 3 [Histomonas meleagridis]
MNGLIGGKYQKIRPINDGQYGIVWLCKNPKTSEEYAVKEIQMNDTVMKEVNALRSLDHPHIIKLIEAFAVFPYNYIVLEYGGDDLYDILEEQKRKPLPAPLVKSYMKQILEAVDYIHSKGIIHRDLKTSNILVNSKNEIKIIDFGVSRPIEGEKNSPVCCTYQYTPIDILFGSSEYSEKFDIWSVGCIFGELLTGDILFNGQSQLDVISKALKILGTPKEDDWPEMNQIEYFKNFVPPQYDSTLRNVIPNQPEEVYDLLQKMLNPSDSRRISAHDALLHPYFNE